MSPEDIVITGSFYFLVVCVTIGSDPHIILGQEMLEPKRDASEKDEVDVNRLTSIDFFY